MIKNVSTLLVACGSLFISFKSSSNILKVTNLFGVSVMSSEPENIIDVLPGTKFSELCKPTIVGSNEVEFTVSEK